MTLIIVIGFLLMIIGGFYLSIKYGHRLRRIKARRNCQICLVLDGSELKDIHLHCIILVFDRLGHLVRKFPEAEMRQMKGQCMLYCTVEEGILNFCVLLAPRALSLSGIVCREDIDRLFRGISEMRIARKTGMDAGEIAKFIREVRPVIYGGRVIDAEQMKVYIDKMNEIINHI